MTLILQIEYLDANPTNGFEVDVDNEAIISCVTTSTGKGEEDEKQHNTCHTSAVLWLKRGTKKVYYAVLAALLYSLLLF